MSRDMVYEDVPRLDRRVGDTLIAGQNNATILLGRDRAGSVDSGYGTDKNAGAIHLVVGRRGPDPSISDDAASVYLSAKTDPDDQAGTGQPSRRGIPSVIVRGDCIRLSARTDVKVSAAGTTVLLSQQGATVTAGSILLGSDRAPEAGVLGTTYRAAEDTLWSAVNSFVGSLTAYSAAIQGIADPTGAATATLTSACGSLISAIASFTSGAARYLSAKTKLE